MQRKEYSRIFKEPAILIEMLNLRREGWSYSALGRLYSCDHTSIRHWCITFGLGTEVIVVTHTGQIPGARRVFKVKPEPTKDDKEWQEDFDGQRIARGKDYEDYLEEQHHEVVEKELFKPGDWNTRPAMISVKL